MVQYDESDALRQYVFSHLTEFMTPLEARAWRFGVMRAKAEHSENPKFKSRVLGEFAADMNVLQPLVGDSADELREFQERVQDRIISALVANELTINRCPACDRVVKTPKARQCLWCGHDWHDRTGESAS